MVIRLKGVTKYYKQLKALDDLTFEIEPGAIGLLGPNGAGKSTLVKALLGLVRLSVGEASVLNHDCRRESRLIREKVGYMPEDDCAIAGLKGVESVAYAGELAGLPPRTSLRRAHEILDFVMIAEERYREVQTYSTGMRQKMKLAQAIIHAPKMVFLDEPTSGLDPQVRSKMLKLIRSLAVQKGVTVILSTHILKDVEEVCDSVVILGKGRLLMQDSIENLKQNVDESILVRFAGDVDAFTRVLEEHKCRVEKTSRERLRIWSDAGEANDLLFKAASQVGGSIRQISPSRNSLEEIFLKAVTGDTDANL